MRTFGLVPRQLLGRGGLIRAIRTFEPFGPQPKVDRVSQDRQMAQSDGSVVTDTLRNFTAALMTVSVIQGAFDGDKIVSPFIQLDVHNFDIGYIKGNREFG
jgi:hypothetical protein